MTIRILKATLLCAALSGCVAIPPDRGKSNTANLLQSRSAVAGKAYFSENPKLEMLDEPLDADGAVRVALNHSPRMQLLYAQLGLAQAQVYDASRLSNPSLGFTRLTDGGVARTTWTVTQSFTELLFLNYHARLGRSGVLQAQQRVAQSVLELEAEVRTAYFRYVVAKLVMQLHEQTSMAATVSADYAQSLFDAGNINQLQLSREQVQATQARIDLQLAQNNTDQHASDLLTLLGVAHQEGYQFMDRLDVPVEQILDAEALQTWAEQQRMDLSMLREQVDMLEASRIHTRRWFWLDGATLQLEREHETKGAKLHGGGGSIGLPVFNQGSGTRLRTQAQLEQVQAELQERQLTMRNDIVAQVTALRRAQSVLEAYRQQLIPLQEQVLQLTQQQQNYALIGTFDLLSAKREMLHTYQDYLRATGEFWIQRVRLSRTVGGLLPDTAGDASYGISIGVDALPEAAPETQSQTQPDPAHSHSHSAGATP